MEEIKLSETVSTESNEINVCNKTEVNENGNLESEQNSSELELKAQLDNPKEINCENDEILDHKENDQNESLSFETMEGEELDYEMAEKEEDTDPNQNKINIECIIEGTITADNEQPKESSMDQNKDTKKPENKDESIPLKSVNKSTHPDSQESVLCQPCNLMFTTKKFLNQHEESDDHKHVIKGSKPRGGKYICVLCWLAFDQSDKLIHHIKMSEHLTRCERKGVKDLFERPGKLQPQWAKDLLAKNSTKSRSRSASSKRRRSNSSNQSMPTSSTWSTSARIKDKSHSSSSRGKSHSIRIIRLSDYYEVSSVGHCDLGGGSRPRSLHVTNGLNSSRKDREAGEPPTKKLRTDKVEDGVQKLDVQKLEVTDKVEDVQKLEVVHRKVEDDVQKLDVAHERVEYGFQKLEVTDKVEGGVQKLDVTDKAGDDDQKLEVAHEKVEDGVQKLEGAHEKVEDGVQNLEVADKLGDCVQKLKVTDKVEDVVQKSEAANDCIDESLVDEDCLNEPITDKDESSSLAGDCENNSVSAQCDSGDIAIASEDNESTSENKTNGDRAEGDAIVPLKENICVDHSCDNDQPEGKQLNDTSMDMEECIEES